MTKISNKPLEALSRNKLLSLAAVLQDIKDELDESVSTSDTVHIDPIVTNKYSWAGWDGFKSSEDEGIGGKVPVSNSIINIKYEWLQYLRDEGIVNGIKIRKAKELDEVDYFEVTIDQKKFADVYNSVTKAAEPYLENQEDSRLFNPTSESVPTSSGDSSHADTNSTHEVDLRIIGKYLTLIIDGKPAEKIKHFKSKNGTNYRACRELLRSKDRYLTRVEMGIPDTSAIKDLPKTMGIKGVIADHFIDRPDNKKLQILNTVEVTHEELEELVIFVKTHFRDS